MTEFRPLAEVIKHGEFTLTQVERQGDLAIYAKQWHSRRRPIYELIRIRRRKAVTFPNSKPTPAREVYPSDNDWGQHGWTHVSLESAKIALGRLILQNTRINLPTAAQSEPEPVPAVLTLPDSQTADLHAMPSRETASGGPADKSPAAFRPLPTTFVDDLYFHEQVERVGNIAIFAKSKGGNDPSFEVVRIRRIEATHFPNGRRTPAREVYPGNEAWGSDGFTYNTIEAARAKLAELVARLATPAPSSSASDARQNSRG